MYLQQVTRSYGRPIYRDVRILTLTPFLISQKNYNQIFFRYCSPFLPFKKKRSFIHNLSLSPYPTIIKNLSWKLWLAGEFEFKFNVSLVKSSKEISFQVSQIQCLLGSDKSNLSDLDKWCIYKTCNSESLLKFYLSIKYCCFSLISSTLFTKIYLLFGVF